MCRRIFVNTECRDQINLYKSHLVKEIDDYIQSELARVAKVKIVEIHNEVMNFSKILNVKFKKNL
jgi:hypothetical protein